jgi:hypothetical protein
MYSSAQIITSSFDTTGKVWYLDGSEVTTIRGPTLAVNAVASFSNIVVTGSNTKFSTFFT